MYNVVSAACLHFPEDRMVREEQVSLHVVAGMAVVVVWVADHG